MPNVFLSFADDPPHCYKFACVEICHPNQASIQIKYIQRASPERNTQQPLRPLTAPLRPAHLFSTRICTKETSGKPVESGPTGACVKRGRACRYSGRSCSIFNNIAVIFIEAMLSWYESEATQKLPEDRHGSGESAGLRRVVSCSQISLKHRNMMLRTLMPVSHRRSLGRL